MKNGFVCSVEGYEAMMWGKQPYMAVVELSERQIKCLACTFQT